MSLPSQIKDKNTLRTKIRKASALKYSKFIDLPNSRNKTGDYREPQIISEKSRQELCKISISFCRQMACNWLLTISDKPDGMRGHAEAF